MREIKFRAWDTSNKKWLDFSYLLHPQKGRRIDDGHPDTVLTFHAFKEEGYILQQYTGLKDRHGVEIYEGDLLGNTMEGFAIAWDEELHSFWPINQYLPEEKSDVHWYEIVEMAGQKRLEVIGNIYENSELLNASKE